MKFSTAGSAGLAACALLMFAAPASADGPRRSGPSSTVTTATTQSIVTFSGYDQARDSSYFFQGVQVALNGDIGRDGFMLRAYGSQVDYDYLNGAVPTHGLGRQGELMIGYKASHGNIWGAAFIGVDHQNHKLTPDDPANRVRGAETGLKVVGDLASLRNTGPLYFALSGMYSTAFDSYWARARVGANLGASRVTIGPEFITLGNTGFDATRLGGFLTFDLKLSPKLPLEVTIYAGHQFVAGAGTATGASGGEGEYVGFSLTSLF